MSSTHRAERPSWDCQLCGAPWPCQPARLDLVSELPRTYLTLFMMIDLADAARDNPQIAPAELYRRFIGWTNWVPPTFVDRVHPPHVERSEEHQPHRPSWDCLACGKPWPCDPARECLVATMDRITLAMYAWDLLERAADEMPGTKPDELFERFLHWTRPG